MSQLKMRGLFQQPASAENLTRLFGALAPKDDAAALYVQRCKDLIDNPPKADWQGLSVLERK